MHTGLTITELSGLTGMSVRNIRAHQSRGLLGPPFIHGRVAYYDAHHVARIELISSMQAEGFTLGAIKHLLQSAGSYAAVVAERRRGLRDGTSAIRPEVPLGIGLETMLAIDPHLVERCVQLGLLRREGDDWMIPTAVAGVGRALVDRGVTPKALADVALDVAEFAHRAARTLTARLEADTEDNAGLAVIAVQLFSALFEAAMAHAVAQQAAERTLADEDGPARESASG
jgi:DNA-binding transcriptional MerR regulator